MGIWWKKVQKNEVPSGGVRISGDPNAWSKWLFILWRFQHKWMVLEIESSNAPYYVYFQLCGIYMRYRFLVKTKRIAIRVPSDDIRFATSTNLSGQSLKIKKVFDRTFTYFEIISHIDEELSYMSRGRYEYISDVTRI